MQPDSNKIINIPNTITLLRVIFCVTLIITLSQTSLNHWQLFVWAAILVIFVMDGLDGFLARRLGSVTMAGSFLDILADRIVEAGFWLYLAYITDTVTWWFPVLLTARVVLVDLCRIGAYVEGQVPPEGIRLNGWKREIVLSEWSRGGYAMVKAITFAALIAMPSNLLSIVLPSIVLGFSLLRGLPIIVEYRRHAVAALFSWNLNSDPVSGKRLISLTSLVLDVAILLVMIALVVLS